MSKGEAEPAEARSAAAVVGRSCIDVYKRQGERLCAVYITSPDYLGGVQDIAALAEVCHARGVPLLVDNAHGAYLKFLSPSRHPLDLGADMCCDSAHKTLPVLTGGAYLHVAKGAMAAYEAEARHSLAVFGSSSPSYLILQSLDPVSYTHLDVYKRQSRWRSCRRASWRIS